MATGLSRGWIERPASPVLGRLVVYVFKRSDRSMRSIGDIYFDKTPADVRDSLFDIAF